MCRPTKRPKPAAQLDSPSPVPSSSSALDAESSFFDYKQLLVEEKPQQQLAEQPAAAIPAPASKQTFVFTTYEMVSDDANRLAVGFDSTGTLIQIRDATMFGEHVLPKYFRHRNVTSFYRQLNSYGFRTIKTSAVDVSHTFVCDAFRRDRPDLLPTIVRKKAAPPPPALAAAQQQAKQRIAAHVAAVAAPVAPVMPVAAAVPAAAASTDLAVLQMIHELQEFQRNQQARALQLEENIRRLASENSKILREGEHVISSMQGMVHNQKAVIHRLFGQQASEAFEAQLKAEAFFPQQQQQQEQQQQQQQQQQQVEMPVSPFAASMADMDLFGGLDAMTPMASGAAACASASAAFDEVKFAFPVDEDLLELETLLAFEDDAFNF